MTAKGGGNEAQLFRDSSRRLLQIDASSKVVNGDDRRDGADIAGTVIEIHNNTLRAPQTPVVIRGVPEQKCEIHHNWFVKQESAAGAVRASAKTKIENNCYGEKPEVAK